MTIREAILVLVTILIVFDTAALIYFRRQDRGRRRTPSKNVLDFHVRVERHHARERGLEAIMRASREARPS
jgi:hypothetical protein